MLRMLQQQEISVDTLIYSSGTQERDFEINPYSRVHQEKLLHFRHEVSCIQNVLQDQSEIMQGLATFCRPTTSVRSLPPNYENDILGDCVSSTKERIANFEAMNSRAMNIGAYVSLPLPHPSPLPSRPFK